MPRGVRVTAPWLAAPESRRVLVALAAEGNPARFVGGCVRDALIQPDLDVDDLDMATPERPERVMDLLAAAGLQGIPTGFRHGTVTALAGRRRFEITTLRRDVACDGRHAEVEFTRDFDEDAARRDFTINAMSCEGDGTLHDPVGGRADLAAGRVRFVGDARQRIVEDYLRILRFFRFHARFGRDPADAAALAACGKLAPGIDHLSGERVRQELWRLVEGPRAAATVRLMQETGVLARTLPGASSLPAFERLVDLFPEADPLLRLAALLRPATPAAVDRLAHRLKLANADREQLLALATTPLPDLAADDRAWRLAIHRLGSALFQGLVRLAAVEQASEPEQARHALALAAAGQPPAFPVGGADLLSRGVPPGPELGRLLATMRREWEEADFQLGRDACLARLDELVGRTARDLTL